MHNQIDRLKITLKISNTFMVKILQIINIRKFP